MDGGISVSIKGKGLVLKTEQDADQVVKLIEANPNATHVQLSGNSLGVDAIKAISEALTPNTTLVVCYECKFLVLANFDRKQIFQISSLENYDLRFHLQ